MKTPPAIALDRLSKQYRGSKTYAIKDVSLAVKPGEVYGFLGPNGAGKSTTIRCLLNFIQPTSGGANILGNDIVKQSVAVKRHIGYLAGDVALYRRMDGRQFLRYMNELQPAKRPNYAKVLIRAFRAELNKPIDQLSKGNRQKIGLIQALMHEPEVLILDEPTAGLDPLMQEVFFAQVAAAKARGVSLFISSHDLSEVRRICDRIGFIRGGKLVAEKTIADLAATASHTFDITFAATAPAQDFKQLRHLKMMPSHDPRHLTFEVEGDIADFLRVLSKHRILQFEQREIDLEEEFLRMYGKGKK